MMWEIFRAFKTQWSRCNQLHTGVPMGTFQLISLRWRVSSLFYWEFKIMSFHFNSVTKTMINIVHIDDLITWGNTLENISIMLKWITPGVCHSNWNVWDLNSHISVKECINWLSCLICALNKTDANGYCFSKYADFILELYETKTTSMENQS